MKLIKPVFWKKKFSFFAFLLLPITLLVMMLNFIKKKITKTLEFNIPIICVGNIFIGGTGKTPLTIFLAKELSNINKNPVILKKLYENQIDENELIKCNFNNLILDSNRVTGIKEAINKKYDTIIIDDGFQDYKIKKNLNIICFHKNQLIGNGYIIPSGPLRESLRSLKDAHIVVINGGKDLNFEKKILKINKNLQIFYSEYVPTNLASFKNKKLLALAAIGNPENFFEMLLENGLNIQKKHIFPDHHKFSKSEVLSIIKYSNLNNLHIVTTEKDYYKLRNFKEIKFEYLKIDLNIIEKNKFIKTITKLYDKIN